MQVIIYGKNLKLTRSIKTFVKEKVETLIKLLDEKEEKLAEARVEIGIPSRHHKSGEVYYAEINLSLGKKLFRASEKHIEMHSAIVKAKDELMRQLRKYKDRELAKRRK